MNWKTRPLVAATIASMGLVACGGGGGGGDDADVLGIVETPDGRILAGDEVIVASDFVGRTFPLLFQSTLDGAPQAITTAGVGSVEFVDADTIFVTIGGQSFTLNRSSATEFTDGTTTFELADSGPSRFLFDTTEGDGFLFGSAFGFETPAISRPATATYNGQSVAGISIALDGFGEGVNVFGNNSVNLTATFTGSGGTITGTMLDASRLIDFANDGTADDELFVTTTLDGLIDAGGFSGNVDGRASILLSGAATEEDLNLSVSNSEVFGKFFGPAAEQASAAYQADASFAPPGQAPVNGRFSGFFLVDR